MNTGSASAFDASSASATVASVVSAPSVTSTRPDTGRPASSWRALSIAFASRVCVPLNVRSAGALTRAVDEENRNVRTRNFSDSAFIIGLSGLAKVWRTDRRGCRGAVALGQLHAARIVDQDADDVLLRDGGLDDQHGRKMQNSMMASAAMRSAPSTTRSRHCTRERSRR